MKKQIIIYRQRSHLHLVSSRGIYFYTWYRSKYVGKTFQNGLKATPLFCFAQSQIFILVVYVYSLVPSHVNNIYFSRRLVIYLWQHLKWIVFLCMVLSMSLYVFVPHDCLTFIVRTWTNYQISIKSNF